MRGGGGVLTLFHYKKEGLSWKALKKKKKNTKNVKKGKNREKREN
jgi:hypothetical protein